MQDRREEPVTAFIRLDPAARARVFSGGAALDAMATGIRPDAVLLEGPDAPNLIELVNSPGATLELDLSASGEGEAALNVPVTLLRDGAGDDGAASVGAANIPDATTALRVGPLSPEAQGRLLAFITRHRKSEHIRIVRDLDTASEGVTTGFERLRLPHEGLPELSLHEIDPVTTAFGRRLAAPILISCMTGGSELARVVNRRLAVAAAKTGLGLGLGSQRAMLMCPALADTYAVRDLAPHVLLVGNIGAVQLNLGVTPQDVEELARQAGADAVAVHLNPLQEAVQPEGDVDFRGLKERVAEVAATLRIPVVLKEVGSGISRSLARWARGTQIAALDTAGAGGTNWAKVESHRARERFHARLGQSFAGWGIPTVDSLIACREECPDKLVIASGGIKSGIDAAKALALGADLVGVARPFLMAAARSEEDVVEEARLFVRELRTAMFCTGASNLAALRRIELQRI